MAVFDTEKVEKIKQYLRSHPRGLTISDLTLKSTLNRNLVAKYLDMLLISGQVEMQVVGAAKVYFLSHRVPISAMLEFSSDFVMVLDTKQQIIQANEQVLNLFHEKREALMGKNIHEINHPLLHTIQALDLLKNDHIPGDKVTEISCDIQGETLCFRLKQVPTAFEDGSQGVTFIFEDITAKKRYEESLKMSEARYRGIVEDQTEFITRFNPDGTLIFVNDSYSRYLGKSPADLLGRFHIPAIQENDCAEINGALSSLDKEHPVTTLECRISDSAGQTCWNFWTIRALFNEEGMVYGYQGVGRDITEKKVTTTRITTYIKIMEFLSQTGKDFLDMGNDEDIYGYISQLVYSLAPGFFVWVGIFHESDQALILKSVMGDSLALDTMKQLTGMKIEEMTIPLGKDDAAELIQHRRLVKTSPLFTCRNLQVIDELYKGIDKTTGGIDFYRMGLVSKGRILGDVGICLKSGSELPNRELIEGFIQQAAIAIDRKITEDALKKSERQRADEALRNSENYLVKIFNSTQSGLMIIDPVTHAIFDANSTASDLIGTDKDNLVGSPCKKWLCLTENDACPVMDLGQKIVRSEGVLKTATGETRSIIKTVSPMQLGAAHYLLESFVDVTERKKAQDALRASEEQLRSLVESAPVGIAFSDSHTGAIDYFNPEFERILGYPLECTSNMSDWFEQMYPDPQYRKKLYKIWMDDLQRFGGTKTYTDNIFRVRCRDGSDKEIRWKLNYFTSGKVLIIIEDFTERKKAEEALRESEERFRLFVESAPIGIAFSDSHTARIEYLNPEFEKIFGYTKEEFQDQFSLFEQMYPDNEYRKKLYEIWMDDLQKCGGKNAYGKRMLQVRCRDGTDKDIWSRVVHFTNGKALTIFEDVTVQRPGREV